MQSGRLLYAIMFGMSHYPRVQTAWPPKRPGSLRLWLVLLVAAAAVPLAVLAGGAVWQAYDIARARMEDQVLARTRLMALLVDREFERMEAGLSVLGASTALRRGDLE